jgi:hypothetical protein
MPFSASFVTGIDANRTVKDDLIRALNRPGVRRRISVTDLVNPRQAFFARTRPDIEIPPDRRQVMMAGTGFHDLFGRAVASEEYVEQFVEYEEIVGKIDIFEEAPIELKTSGTLPDDPLAARPGQVEQLAMYCVMTGRPLGHLLYYQRAEFGREPGLRAFDLQVLDPAPIRVQMLARRDAFRRALETRSGAHLPRCEWFQRDCLYQDFCGCADAQPLVRMVNGATVQLAENSQIAAQIETKILQVPEPQPGGQFNLNDLVFPRKALLRTEPAEDEEEPAAADRMGAMERRGFMEQLENAVWYGTAGACRRQKFAFESLRPIRILLFHDLPTLIRSTKRREMIPRDRLSTDAPYYVDRLAFECAIADRPRGRLIVYYSSQPDDKFMVYDFWFRDLPAIRAEMQRRLGLLESRAPADQLPACEPDWMAKLCDFGDRCACRTV